MPATHRQRLVSLVGLAVLLFTSPGGVGALEVSGDQYGTWSLASSPIIVTGWVNVPSGQSLTIEAGVEVRFNAYQGVNVYGLLDARGTSAAPIIFTSAGEQSPDWWNGIAFWDGSQATLTHCQIRYAGYWDDAAVRVYGSAAPLFDHCLISDVSGDGVRLFDAAQPTLTNTTISGVTWPVRSYGWNALPASLEGNTYGAAVHRGMRLESPDVPEGQSQTWRVYADGVPYSVAGAIDIGAGATLTLQPGIVVKFDAYQGINVYGFLDAQGTAGAPVLLTAWTDDTGGDTNADGSDTAPAADWWNSIAFWDGSNGTLRHCQIRYAGYWDDAAVRVHGSAAPQLDHCLISDVSGDGVRLFDAAQPTVTNTTIRGVTWPVHSYAWNALPASLEGNTYGDAVHYGIRLDYPDVPEGATQTWRVYADGVPYSVAGAIDIGTGATLTLEPGIVVKFDAYQGINVYGFLDAQGTEGAPILLTAWTDDTGGDTNADGSATAPAADWWNSIAFWDGSNGTLTHCQIRYAGYWDDAAVRVLGSAAPLFDYCLISDVAGDGVRVFDSAQPTVTNTAIRGVTWPVRSYAWSALPASLEGNTYGEAVHYGIRLDYPDVPEGATQTWRAYADGLPYSVAGTIDIGTGATLTLQPGIVVKFDAYQGINVSGFLDARGTPDAPILLTAGTDDTGGDTNADGSDTAPAADWWNSIAFWDGSNGTLSHCQIRYAGYWEDAAVRVYGSAAPTIAYTEIGSIAGDGVRVFDSASPRLTPQLVFADVTGFAVNNRGAAVVNARDNWWGAPSGPQHAQLNPGGTGFAVSDGVDFSPYLDVEPELWQGGYLYVQARIGQRRSDSPLVTTVGRLVRFEVSRFTLPDSSDMELLAEYSWDVPAELGTVTGLGQLELTTVAGVRQSIVFAAGGATAEFVISTLPQSIERVVIEPADLTIDPGQRQTFSARAYDRYGNQITGRSFGWHVVGDIGTINQRTGAFVAADAPGQGYVIAVVSRVLVFGDTGATVQGTGKIVVRGLPERFALHPNAPNPFNPETEIRFDLPSASPVRLAVYNLLGQEVERLVEEMLPAGRHSVRWNAYGHTSGLYFYRIEAGTFTEQRKMTLLR